MNIVHVFAGRTRPARIRPRPLPRHGGFTLVELLVALAVAAMLGLFIFVAYSAISVSGLRVSDESQAQNTARVALTLLADDVARSGFMMNGPSGQNRCARLLVYNGKISSAVQTQWPISAVAQTSGGKVPGTSTPFGYAAPGGAQTDALSVVDADGFGVGQAALPGGVRVVRANNGTLENAALFVANPSSFNRNDVDIVVLPSPPRALVRSQAGGTPAAWLPGKSSTRIARSSSRKARSSICRLLCVVITFPPFVQHR